MIIQNEYVTKNLYTETSQHKEYNKTTFVSVQIGRSLSRVIHSLAAQHHAPRPVGSLECASTPGGLRGPSENYWQQDDTP
jgi:hypothetical protein